MRGLAAGRLVGTHAHELVMITAKLLARYDDAAGSAEEPVPVAALLAHLLYLRANGGLDSAISLADTFGTAAFVEVRRRALCRTSSNTVQASRACKRQKRRGCLSTTSIINATNPASQCNAAGKLKYMSLPCNREPRGHCCSCL